MKTPRLLTLTAAALICVALLSPAAFAKRAAPVEVKPVVLEGVEYRAPHFTLALGKMGVVEAWDKAKGKMLWAKKAYAVEINPDLERDVLDVFITKLEIDARKLIVTNERNDRYSIDLKTQEITVLGKEGRVSLRAADAPFHVTTVSPEQAKEYKLDAKFYKKGTLVQDILIATSERVSDFAHLEAAYLLDTVMSHLPPPIAQRIRDKKVLCVLVGHAELQSDVPQWATDKTGAELDFYNWRGRGELTEFDGRPTFLFSEEDVMEYPGGMDLESVLIHEFAHVIDGVGFDKTLQDRLHTAFQHAMDKGLYMDGYAAQKFRRVTSVEPVGLLDALVNAFPAQPRAFLTQCLDGSDILVNGQPSRADVKVTRDDKVLIVFGGPKQTYWALNKAEYWAEGVQAWYDTCRTMDHDHNHIHNRDQLKAYDPELAKLIADVLGDSPWRFVSPRTRAGTGHLAGYDPSKAPKVVPPEHIDRAGQDYHDEQWKDFWKRLHDKYPAKAASKDQ